MPSGTKGWQHGTRTGYETGCRCEECKLANRLYKRAWQGSVAMDEYLRLQRARVKHGTSHMYLHYKCRCEECRAENARRQREYQAKMRAQNAGV